MAKEPAAVSPSDEVLLKRIQEEGDGKAQDILLARYKELVKKKTSLYYMAGAERDDIVQEGMIGLFKAIRDYRFDQRRPLRCLPSCASTDRSFLPSRGPIGRSTGRLIPTFHSISLFMMTARNGP